MKKGQIFERTKKTWVKGQAEPILKQVVELVVDVIDLGVLGRSPVVEVFDTREQAEARKTKLGL